MKDQLEEFLGLDTSNQEDRLAVHLAEQDELLIDQLVQMRKDAGLRQADVATRIDRDQATISNFERLGGDPRLSTIRRYALAVGASIDHAVTPADEAVRNEQLSWGRLGPVVLELLHGSKQRQAPHHTEDGWDRNASEFEVKFAHE